MRWNKKIHQMSCYSPPSLSLSGWSVPVLLCPESSQLWEKPADVNAPHTSLDHWPAESFEDAVWVTGRRRTAWNVLFALRLRHWLWRWCFSSSSSSFFFSFFQLLSSSSVIESSPHSIPSSSQEGQVLHRTLWTPSPVYPHPNPSTLCFFDYLLFLQNPNGSF